MSITHRSCLALALAVAAGAVGCGSDKPASPKDQVRETARTATAALMSDHPERACQYMLDRETCIGVAVLIKDMDFAAMSGIPGDWEDRLDQATVKVSGDTATISDFNGDGKPGRYILRGGKWLADNREN